MKPFVKWQGGKRREFANIRPFISSPIAEPFCGGAAVAFELNGKAYLNDTNSHLINLYQVVADERLIDPLLADISLFKQMSPDQLNERYYQARDYINTRALTENPYISAREFLFVRQQCFSGMERYNSKGAFNVPHGRYKTFSCSLTKGHHEFLANATITQGDAIDFIHTLPPDVFLFIDPPYLDRAGYENGDGGLNLHTRLHNCLSKVANPWLIVHSDHEFYRDNYSRFTIHERPYKYSQQWVKGEYNNAVNHLYITNA